MRIIALDIGDSRVGIAVSDGEGRLAFPVKVLPTAEVLSMASSFKRILEDYEPELLLAGLPLSLTGEESQQTEHVRQQAQSIAQACGLALVFQDERLSSAEAKRKLREDGLTEREMRGKVDMIAASLFLQAYLDAQEQEDEESQ